jgi:hypothetical protein
MKTSITENCRCYDQYVAAKEHFGIGMWDELPKFMEVYLFELWDMVTDYTEEDPDLLISAILITSIYVCFSHNLFNTFA